MQGVRLGRDELIRTFGISRRLAVRIGALSARGLTVTATLLEIAGPGSPLEKYLLLPELLDSAETLSASIAQRLAAQAGVEAEGLLTVVQTEEARVLALEEELLAEEGWQAQAEPEEPGALMRREVALSVGGILDRKEAEQLFTSEEIARLKLEALAGRDDSARISALRKLLHAPLTTHLDRGIA